MTKKYCAVTPESVEYFETHQEAFDKYETQPEPKAVCVLVKRQKNTYAIGINVSVGSLFSKEGTENMNALKAALDKEDLTYSVS